MIFLHKALPESPVISRLSRRKVKKVLSHFKPTARWYLSRCVEMVYTSTSAIFSACLGILKLGFD